jgi:hypothetical protein
VAKVQVPRKGVTQAELATVLSRRLGAQFQVAADGEGSVIARRSPLRAAVVRITGIPGATVFRSARSACRSSASARHGSSPTPCAGHRSSAPSDRLAGRHRRPAQRSGRYVGPWESSQCRSWPSSAS